MNGRVSDSSYISKPTLINPQDSIYVTAYLTYSDDDADAPDLTNEEIELNYQVRIANLKEITEREPLSLNFDISGPPIYVGMAGWGIFLFVSLFCLFFSVQYSLFIRSGLARRKKSAVNLIILGFALLSIMSSEVVTYYLAPAPLSEILSATFPFQILNISILVAQSSIIFYMLARARAEAAT